MNLEHQIKMKEQLKAAYPGIANVAAAYATVYPFDSTPLEVIDAVTVPVSLRLFMLMAAYVGNFIAVTQPEGEGGDEFSAGDMAEASAKGYRDGASAELAGLAASVAP